MVTCLDSGIVHYWLPSHKPLKPVLSMSLNDIFLQQNLSLSLRYYLEVSNNYLNGFLQVVSSNDNLLFFWITCTTQMASVDFFMDKTTEIIQRNEESVKSIETGRSRRLAAAKAMQFYTSLTITEEGDSDNYVKSAESSDSEIGLTLSGSDDISMLPNQHYKYIGKYAHCNTHLNKDNPMNILTKFDYRKPLVQEFKASNDSLQYCVLCVHCLSDGKDVTAIKLGSIVYGDENFYNNDENGKNELATCNIVLANVTGAVQLLKFTFSNNFQQVTRMYVYEQQVLLVSPATLVMKDFHQISGQKCAIVAFSSSNELFITYGQAIAGLSVEFQIIFLKIFSVMNLGCKITCKLIAVGNNGQLVQYKVAISGGSSISIVKDNPTNTSINTAIEITYLAKDNPFKVIGAVSIPGSYYITELHHVSNLFELTLGISNDLDNLNAELMEIVSNYYLGVYKPPSLILTSRFVKRFHPLVSMSLADDVSTNGNSLIEIFNYLAKLLSTTSEVDYYKGIVMAKISTIRNGDYLDKLCLVQLLSNIVYSVVTDIDIRDILLTKIDIHRRCAIIQMIEDGSLSGENVRGIVGNSFPINIILENLKTLCSDGLLIAFCFCGEVAECVPPFYDYICKKSHKFPCCSITRCGLVGSTFGVIIPTKNDNKTLSICECSYKIMYNALDYCTICRRFAIGLCVGVKGCLICGGKTVVKKLSL